MNNYTFKDFFSAKDTHDVTHIGFMQSLDLSGYTDITLLNDITNAILDMYLYKEMSRAIALDHWGSYLAYDKGAGGLVINPDFYEDFAPALYVEILRSQKFNTSILTYDFKSISKQEIKEIVHGTKTTTRNYDKVHVEITRGKDKQTIGQREDTIGEREDENTPGNTTETNKIFPLGGIAYQDDTQTETAQLKSTSVTGEQVNTTGEQIIDVEHGDVENDTDAREDQEEIATYTDTETYTKHVIISPEKFFAIQKELAEINAYTLLRDAVNRAFARGVWV